MCTYTLTNICISTSSFHTTSQVLTNLFAFHVATTLKEPTFYHEEKGIQEWEDAMTKELTALDANNT